MIQKTRWVLTSRGIPNWWSGGDSGSRNDVSAGKVAMKKKWSLEDLRKRGYEIGPHAVGAAFSIGTSSWKEVSTIIKHEASYEWSSAVESILDRLSMAMLAPPNAHDAYQIQLLIKRIEELVVELNLKIDSSLIESVRNYYHKVYYRNSSDINVTVGNSKQSVAGLLSYLMAADTLQDFEIRLNHIFSSKETSEKLSYFTSGDCNSLEPSLRLTYLSQKGDWKTCLSLLDVEELTNEGAVVMAYAIEAANNSKRADVIEAIMNQKTADFCPSCVASILRVCWRRTCHPDDVWSRLASELYSKSQQSKSVKDSIVISTELLLHSVKSNNFEAASLVKTSVSRLKNKPAPALLSLFADLLEKQNEASVAEMVRGETKLAETTLLSQPFKPAADFIITYSSF